MKRKYLVRFYCGTDCRIEITIKSFDELQAIVCACNELGIEGWTLNGPEFRIEISHDQDN